jgi:hypothetical protein
MLRVPFDFYNYGEFPQLTTGRNAALLTKCSEGSRWAWPNGRGQLVRSFFEYRVNVKSFIINYRKQAQHPDVDRKRATVFADNYIKHDVIPMQMW